MFTATEYRQVLFWRTSSLQIKYENKIIKATNYTSKQTYLQTSKTKIALEIKKISL